MSESTASRPAELDGLALRPDRPGVAGTEPAAPRPPAVSETQVLLAQAILPGLGYLLLRQWERGVFTFVAFALLGLVGYWQFPKDAAQPGSAWVAFAVLMGLVWLNLLYRTTQQMRALAAQASVAGSGSSTLQQVVLAQRRGMVRALLGLNWLVIALAVFGINRLAVDAEVDLLLFTRSSNLNAARILAAGLFHPRWSIAGDTIRTYAWISLEMAILGTLGGAVLAAPVSFLAARNLMGRHPLTRPLYYVLRLLFSCVRAIPTLIWGLIAVSFALSHFPGVIALTIFSFGLLAKLYSEAIEAIDWGQIEAVTATGANPVQVIVFAAVPQVVPYFVAHTLYALEVNIHSAVVLGLIGAGGLGLVINEYIGSFAWSQASMVLIITIVMTLTIDYGSAYIRSRIV